MVLCRMSRIPRHGGMGDGVELVHCHGAQSLGGDVGCLWDVSKWLFVLYVANIREFLVMGGMGGGAELVHCY